MIPQVSRLIVKARGKVRKAENKNGIECMGNYSPRQGLDCLHSCLVELAKGHPKVKYIQGIGSKYSVCVLMRI